MELTINQRFRIFIDKEKISQIDFADKAGMLKATVSDILKGKTKQPKANFFQALLIHYPQLNLKWLLIGEEPMLINENATPMFREKQSSYQNKDELLLQELIKTVRELAAVIPSLQAEIKTIKKEVRELRGGIK